MADQKKGGGSGAPPRREGAPGPGRPNIQIHADETAAKGVYSNSALVNVSENEITLDFIYLPPQTAGGYLRSRVILSPRQAKQLVKVLGDSVERYEQRFGPIEEPRKSKPVLH